jgi:hypothetical protein
MKSLILISEIFLLTITSYPPITPSAYYPFSTNTQSSESRSPSMLRSLMLADPKMSLQSSIIINFE